jgi:hypothetical protein
MMPLTLWACHYNEVQMPRAGMPLQPHSCRFEGAQSRQLQAESVHTAPPERWQGCCCAAELVLQLRRGPSAGLPCQLQEDATVCASIPAVTTSAWQSNSVQHVDSAVYLYLAKQLECMPEGNIWFVQAAGPLLGL